MKKINTNTQESKHNEITRKEAIKKAGKYAALTAVSMLIVLSPKESQAQSPGSPSKPTPWT